MRIGRIEYKKFEPAGDFLLAKESVIGFMQNFIADVVDDRNETLTKTEEQTLIYLMLMT